MRLLLGIVVVIAAIVWLSWPIAGNAAPAVGLPAGEREVPPAESESLNVAPAERERVEEPAEAPAVARALEISGWVESPRGRVAGAHVLLLSKGVGSWPVTDFWADTTSAEAKRAIAVSGGATLSAVTDEQGAFVIRGVEPGWSCALTLDDRRWISTPIAKTAKPGEESVVLRVEQATGVDIVYVAASDGTPMAAEFPVSVLVTIGNEIMSRSFSIAGGRTSAAFCVLPERSWQGTLDYEVSARSRQRAFATTRGKVDVGEIARVEIPCRVPEMRILDVAAQWHDGTPCRDGVTFLAEDRDGNQVPAALREDRGGVYRLAVDESAQRLRIMASDALRDWQEAQVLEVASLASGSVATVTMPAGAEVVIYGPDPDSDALVGVGATFGQVMVNVRGELRLRGVAPGEVKAWCDVAGTRRRASVEVSGTGTFALDLTK